MNQLSQTPVMQDYEPVYGNPFAITLTAWSMLAMFIIRQSIFQRLQGVFQHGTIYKLFPAISSLTRDKHCASCGRISRSLAQHLSDNSKISNKLSDVELSAVEVAGVCHDIGHGPCSHMFESISKKLGIEFDHEKKSIEIVKSIFNDKTLKKFKLPNDFATAVEMMIVGCTPVKASEFCHGNSKFKNPFIFFLINGTYSNEFDTDKIDYMLRDTYCYFPPMYDILIAVTNRVITSMRVVEEEKEGMLVQRIIYDENCKNDLKLFFKIRFWLYQSFYYLPVVSRFEIAYQQILPLLAHSIRSEIEEFVTNHESFVQFNDNYYEELFERVEQSFQALQTIPNEKNNISFTKSAHDNSENLAAAVGLIRKMSQEDSFQIVAMRRINDLKYNFKPLSAKFHKHFEGFDNVFVQCIVLHHGVRPGNSISIDPVELTEFASLRITESFDEAKFNEFEKAAVEFLNGHINSEYAKKYSGFHDLCSLYLKTPTNPSLVSYEFRVYSTDSSKNSELKDHFDKFDFEH